MRVLADANMPLITELFSDAAQQLGIPADITTYSSRQPSAAQLKEAQVLLVRSVTKVDSDLLKQAPKLEWVGTATIGTEHIDQAALTKAGIRVHSTPGVNADAVGDYVVSAIAAISLERGALPQGEVAIVGAGHTGRAAAQRLMGLGLPVHFYDPPLVEKGGAIVPVHDDWQRVLNSSLISLHVPLTPKGSDSFSYPTQHMFGYDDWMALPKRAIVVNACRGAVINEHEALRACKSRQDLTWIADVFEHEPQISDKVMACLHYATPHIAGHSLAGKLRGSLTLLTQWLSDQKLEAKVPTLEELLQHWPTTGTRRIARLQAPVTWQLLATLVLGIYDIRDDDGQMRKIKHSADAFDTLRKEYQARAELSQLTVKVDGSVAEHWRERLRKLSFDVVVEDSSERSQ